MKIQDVILHNFGSFFGTHYIELANRGLTFVRGENLDEPKMESNGAGKSTLFDGIAWCLFGHVPKGDLAKSVINEEHEAKDAFVVVHLVDKIPNGPLMNYWVVRERKGATTVKFWSGEEAMEIQNHTAMDVNVTQELINQALGLDKDVFYAAVYRSQGEGDEFAEATDAKRKELLTKIIPELAEVDTHQERAKQLLKDQQLKLSDEITKRQAAEQELVIIRGRDFDAEQKAWASDRWNRLQQAQTWHEQAQAGLENGKMAVARLQEIQQNLSALQAPMVTKSWASTLEARKIKLQNTMECMQPLNTQAALLSQQIQKLVQLDVGACTRCGQLITPEHKNVEHANLLEELGGVELDLIPFAAAVQREQAEVTEAEAYAQQEEDLHNQQMLAYTGQKAALEAELKTLGQTNLFFLEQKVKETAAQVLAINAEIWPGEASRKQAEDRILELQDIMAACLKQEAQTNHVIKHLSFWHSALSNAGLKSYILDSRIEEMTTAANEWVSALTGGTTWIRFETQTLTQGGKLNEKFNIRVFRHDPDGGITERNFKSWSGGEKKRVSLGIDQGISKLIADRAAKHWDLYIIDESFRQHLDQGGREAVFELLEKLGNERESIFVVDHDPQMGAQFEKQLLVRIQNRRSSFPEEPPCPANASPGLILPSNHSLPISSPESTLPSPAPPSGAPQVMLPS